MTGTIADDPPVLHRLATEYGRAVAEGNEHYLDALERLIHIAIWHPKVDLDKLDDVIRRMERTLCDAAAAEELRAERDIRRAIAPMLKSRAKSSAIRTEAYRAAAARLLRPDVDLIVQAAMAEASNGALSHG